MLQNLQVKNIFSTKPPEHIENPLGATIEQIQEYLDECVQLHREDSNESSGHDNLSLDPTSPSKTINLEEKNKFF